MDRKDRLESLWQELFKQQPTNDDLRYIIEYVEPLRAEAWKCLKRTRSEIMEEIKKIV